MRTHSSASGLGAKIDEGEFEFSRYFNHHLNPFQSFLSLLVVK